MTLQPIQTVKSLSEEVARSTESNCKLQNNSAQSSATHISLYNKSFICAIISLFYNEKLKFSPCDPSLGSLEDISPAQIYLSNLNAVFFFLSCLVTIYPPNKTHILVILVFRILLFSVFFLVFLLLSPLPVFFSTFPLCVSLSILYSIFLLLSLYLSFFYFLSCLSSTFFFSFCFLSLPYLYYIFLSFLLSFFGCVCVLFFCPSVLYFLLFNILSVFSSFLPSYFFCFVFQFCFVILIFLQICVISSNSVSLFPFSSASFAAGRHSSIYSVVPFDSLHNGHLVSVLSHL